MSSAPPTVETIPAAILASDRGVIWKFETRKGKPTKVPYIATEPQHKAKSNDPGTWRPFRVACTAALDGKADGAGVVLGDGHAGVDLDHCRDQVTGTIAPWAQQIINAIDSYTEVSPSSAGVKIFIAVDPTLTLRNGKHNRPDGSAIEMFSSGKFFAVTGRHLPGTPTTIEERTGAYRALHAQLFSAPKNGQCRTPPPPPPVADDDQTLIDRACRATNGAKFSALWAGDWSGYPSQSEADQALCNLLAFWTGADAGRMDGLFRQSGLMRDKWDTRRNDSTYGALTIDCAIAGCRETYTPGTGRAPGPDAAERRDTAVEEDMPITFHECDGRYTFEALDGTIILIVDRLRRERYHLVGELEVRCHLAGARTYGGHATLLITTLNCSSARARQDVARLIGERAKTGPLTIDWAGYLEDFTQRIWAHERQGHPSQWLHEIPRPAADATLMLSGFPILRHHPQIIFSPGGTGKSLVGAALVGELGRHGVRTLILDWEMDGSEQRARRDALDLPHTIRYCRCDQPLVVLADSIRRDVVEHGIEFLLLDSVAPACNGRVEEAEVAIEFFKAWRRIGKGGLAIAHTRSEDGEQRPFGSVFWHNLARSTWFLKRVGEQATPNVITLGVYHRKANFGPLRAPFGLELALQQDGDTLSRVLMRRVDVADVVELAASLPLWQRMKHALRGGAMTIQELATELESKPDTVKKALTRDQGRAFICLANTEDGIHRWAIVERRAS